VGRGDAFPLGACASTVRMHLKHTSTVQARNAGQACYGPRTSASVFLTLLVAAARGAAGPPAPQALGRPAPLGRLRGLSHAAARKRADFI